jgi:hypothetical protein
MHKFFIGTHKFFIGTEEVLNRQNGPFRRSKTAHTMVTGGRGNCHREPRAGLSSGGGRQAAPSLFEKQS